MTAHPHTANRPFRSFVLQVALFTLILLGGPIFLVGLMDPFGLLGTPLLDGFNREKVTRDYSSRLAKPLQFLQGDYNALVLGTSRAGDGIDPRSPHLAPWRVYNGSLLLGTVHELSRFMTFAQETRPLALVLWGLDFLSFPGQSAWRGNIQESLLFNSPLMFRLKHLINLDTTRQAWQTLLLNRSGRPGQVDGHPNGWFGLPTRDPIGHDYRQVFPARARHDFCNPTFLTGYRFGPEVFDPLEEALARLKPAGVRIVLFVSPIHALHMELMHRRGLYPTFKNWLAGLAHRVHAVDARTPGPHPIVLYDFSGYNSVTTEAFPTGEGTDPGFMRWYWESVHYKVTTGDRILAQVLAPPGTQPPEPLDFGQPLTPATVMARVAALDPGRELYVRKWATDIARIYDPRGCPSP
ncbi:MAG: hypothetical protein HQL82_03915 [Magnetococcales bacterium]|nr:hypothetical protein [Magnetococcales bacterium]